MQTSAQAHKARVEMLALIDNASTALNMVGSFAETFHICFTTNAGFPQKYQKKKSREKKTKIKGKIIKNFCQK